MSEYGRTTKKCPAFDCAPLTSDFGLRIPDFKDEQGSALVEYAIVLTVLLTFLFGIMDFSRFLYTYHFVAEVAREGSRYAIVRGSTFSGTSCTTTSFACDATNTDVQNYVRGLAPPGITASSVGVNATWTGTAPSGSSGTCSNSNGNNGPGCQVQVVVSYPFKFIFPFLPKSSWTVSSTSVMVIIQ